MQLSNYIIFAAIEVFIVLIAIGAFLLMHAHKQRKLIRRQQEKLLLLVEELKRLKLSPIEITGNTYKTHINSQITATRNRFTGTFPQEDITALQVHDCDPAQKALALRHQFLLVEEQAISKGDGPLQINWQAFVDGLLSVDGLGGDNSTADELAICRREIENLGKFRQLFFDMEQQWQDAQKEAQDYYTQLLAMADNVDNNEQFTDILERYHKVYNSVDEGFEHGRNNLLGNSTVELKTVEITRIDPRSNEEIIKLRNVAADQHRIISQLQKKLEQAVTAEAKAAIVTELEQQLQRQVRFVQESETCIKLLEDELSAATEKVNKQQQQLQNTIELQQENSRIKETLHNFTLESKELMGNIITVETENDALKAKVKPTNDQKNDTPANEALKSAQSELISLKGQYADLEEKYLKLKLKGK